METICACDRGGVWPFILASRRLIGWAVSNRMKRDLVIRALNISMASTIRTENSLDCVAILIQVYGESRGGCDANMKIKRSKEMRSMAFVNAICSTLKKAMYIMPLYLATLIASQSTSSAILDNANKGSHIANEIIKLFDANDARISMTELFSNKYIICFTINSISPTAEALRIFPNAIVDFDESDDSNKWHIIKYNTIKKELSIYGVSESYIRWNIERDENPIEINNYDTTCTNIIELYNKNGKYYINPVNK